MIDALKKLSALSYCMVTSDLPQIKLPRKPNYVKFKVDGDFFELFETIEPHFENCFFLESLGEANFDSRYSVIGFSPEMVIRSTAHTLYINDKEYKTQNPYYALREIIPQNIISRNYAGGLVGYLGYDAMNFFEPALDIQFHPDFDAFLFGVYTDGLVYDAMTGETFYFYYHTDRRVEIENVMKKTRKENKVITKKTGQTKTENEHKKMVEKAIQQIIEGNTFQCQIGFATNYEIQGNPLEIYKKLREINPSPYMFYLKFNDTKMLGASPELLFQLRQGEMETFPLAGTTRRGGSSEEDRKLARILLNDPKEIAEHNMLVDLHRNDIGRVAKFGSVKVRRLMDVKKFSHVQHISSEVVGLIKNNEDMFSGLAKVFPAGTLSGAPKIESMKIIDRIENEPRGPYGGAIGHFGFNGDCAHAIPIRTLFIKGDKAFSRASGGIVYDSTAENEYNEIIRKSAAMQQVLDHFMEKK